DTIATRGALASEVPCGATPTKWRFLARNRVIAALADATVVVEAGHRSGSLNTAGHAASLGRALGAVPGPVTSAASAGCHRLLREYDAVCVTDAADVCELIGLAAGSAAAPDGPSDRASTRILDALSSRTGRTPEDLAVRSGMSLADCVAALGLLEVAGAVRREPDGTWRRVPPG
ncbi:DNA-processing protein DprA, partial [Microbacterium sp.]|uniref:DNA-processing protein DprA n=1 Tax=Microbacterium sp. TaxID=51671 RepID=UPI003A8938D8